MDELKHERLAQAVKGALNDGKPESTILDLMEDGNRPQCA